MFRKFKSRNQKNHGGGMRAQRPLRGQAIVEFAIALPVLMMLLVGLMEVGRMLFMYASVVNASRDAVRYASAYGRSDTPDDGFLKYSYCDGIRQTARQSGFILNLSTNPTSGNIKITYDSGPGTSPIVTEVSTGNACDAASGEDANVVGKVDTGDRVTVKVTATYNPMLSLLPFGTRTFTATTSRTILGVMDLD